MEKALIDVNKMSINVYTANEKKAQGDLFGIFFEDLNHAADGGLYGELVRNRSFEFDRVDAPEYHSMTAWSPVERGDSVAQAHVEAADPLNRKNPHYLVLEVMTEGEGGGVSNEGFGAGIPLEKGKKYYFSCYCRSRMRRSVPLEVRLEDSTGTQCYAREEIVPKEKGSWKKYELTLAPEQTDYQARLVLLMKEPGAVELDMVSLFPADTFGEKRGGLRRDIAEMIRDMKPKFLRFPGGCLTHIGSLDRNDRSGMYRWKNTVGSLEERPARRNIWNYNQTFGLGFYEFFCFCEEIGAEPLPVISAGYDPHYLREADLDDMQEWIDEALDLIEFANGSTDTEWGALRAKMGHPESFHMKYLGIGNEEVGEGFFERYEFMLKAVKERWPEIRVINSAGPGSGGSEFEKGWEQACRTETSCVDEHFYQCPEWFLANADRYASYQPSPKAFLGEYASHDDTWGNALAEAAFMTGMEKAEGVGLACYAPMLCHVDYVNWKPVMLYYDNHRVYGSPSYYVQKLFMNYQGTRLLETKDDLPVREKEAPGLSGAVAFRTGKADVEITGFCFTDKERGTQEGIPDFGLSAEHAYHKCLDTGSSHYEISFRFRKRNGNTSGNLNGAYSFELEFAGRDEQNRLGWNIDGWQRLTALRGFCKGSECDMGLHFFASERERTYEARLSVDGNHVRTYIDGAKYCDHVCRSAEPEEVYYSAVKEEDGSVIVKAVNAKAEGKELEILLRGDEKFNIVEVIAMEGFRPEERNSFEEPRRVVPANRTENLAGNQFRYVLQGNSFAVMVFKP